MAEAEDSSTPDLMVFDGRINLSQARRLVALKAAWEIESLSRQAPMIGDHPDIDAADVAHVLRGVCARIRGLSDVVVGALSDEGTNAEELAAELR